MRFKLNSNLSFHPSNISKSMRSTLVSDDLCGGVMGVDGPVVGKDVAWLFLFLAAPPAVVDFRLRLNAGDSFGINVT